MSAELGEIQAKFADLIWEHAPIPSGELVKLAKEQFGWQRPTMYTVLRILCQKGLFRNENSIVTPVMTREEYYTKKTKETVESGFNGSLPSFIAAFCRSEDLSYEELKELQEMISTYLREKGEKR